MIRCYGNKAGLEKYIHMKSKSIIFIGIIVAAYICTTQFSGLTEILKSVDKSANLRIERLHKKQINKFIPEKRKPLKRICLI